MSEVKPMYWPYRERQSNEAKAKIKSSIVLHYFELRIQKLIDSGSHED